MAVLALTIVTSVTPARAQLRLPGVNLPVPTGLPQLGNDTLQRTERLLDQTRLSDLTRVRTDFVTNLLRQQRDRVEPDPRGAPVLRHEILAWSPNAAGLAAARAAGLRVLRERRLEGLDETVITLGVPEGADTATLLEQLRALDPDGVYDFNHLYQGSGGAGVGMGADARTATPSASGVTVGLVDSGVDAQHPVFAGTSIRRWGCNGAMFSAFHGSAVAALMAGQSEHFRGVLPGATVFAADIYCGSPTGGDAATIADALGWMAQQKVAVVNLSIVGPANRTLERAVAAMQRRGHLLVAAVGNDGPAAPPLYPASYPGVVGVSAIDRRGRLLPEAARGPQVMFAAPGHDMVSATPGAPPYRRVRGTSFAAPIVAALLAERLRQPDPAAAQAALAALAAQATPLADAGRGVVGARYRVDPSVFSRD